MLRKFFKTLTTTGLDIRWIGLRDDLHGRGQHRLRPKVERTSRTERFLLRSSGKKPTTITYQNVSFVQIPPSLFSVYAVPGSTTAYGR